jgi:ribokinase
MSNRLKIAVIGHVEHVTIAAVRALPLHGEIAHLDDAVWIPGGGGGIAFHQLARSGAELHLFTAIGDDDAGRAVLARVEATGASVHAARRAEPHTRDIVLITPDHERTILVVGRPLHPRIDDALPWDVLASCDAAYFTGEDPETLRAARSAKVLVATARRRASILASGVRCDVIVGSSRDPRESSTMADYPVAPGALVMTDGARGGRVETGDGTSRFEPTPPTSPIVGSYGAGDTFAGALTWYVARGVPIVEACERAGAHATSVLAGLNPLEHQAELS